MSIEAGPFSNPYVLNELQNVAVYEPADLAELEKRTETINDAILYGYRKQRNDAAKGVISLNHHPLFPDDGVHTNHLIHQAVLVQSHNDLEGRVNQRADTLHAIAEKFTAADTMARVYIQENMPNLNDLRQRNMIFAAFRVNAFDGFKGVFDIDGTLTKDDPKYVYYDKTVPGTVFCDKHMATSRKVFPEVYPGGWGQVQEQFQDHFKLAGKMATEIRPGVDELFHHIRQLGGNISILTAGMRPLADGILSKLIHNNEIQEVRAIDLVNVTSNNKPPNILEMATEHEALFYVGDGGSDITLAQANLPISFFFALKDGKFAKELKKQNLVYFTYPDDENAHFETMKTLDQILIMAQRIKNGQHLIAA
ncbi:MAG: hypothetical protein ACEQSA_04885 [Weeksellaceae bacterium]